MIDGKIKNHHLFKNSGWISFYLHNKQDVAYACHLLKKVYDRARENRILYSVRLALIFMNCSVTAIISESSPTATDFSINMAILKTL